MAILKFVFSAIITALLFSLLHFRVGELPLIGEKVEAGALARLPALGNFFDPYHGFWQNAASTSKQERTENLHLEGLKEAVSIYYDERRVPHIFAQNERDAYMAQAYVTARDRLWQMEIQTHAAAGRLAERFGMGRVEFDRQQRRLGMVWAAENMLEAVRKDLKMNDLMQAYTDGVNAYIKQLNSNELPLEYKLMGFEPEAWTPLKCALMSKQMAYNLTARDKDIEMSNLLQLLGSEVVEILYPDFAEGLEPIIPKETVYNFDAPPPPQIENTNDDDGVFFRRQETELPDPDNGSNNWAVSGSKTQSGNAILCNDPHLFLQFPSVWYEVQLHTPEMNVYGVSLPGTPGVIIGFNERIAWGITNAGRDVRDWYKIKFEDEKKLRYQYGDKWRETSKRIETIKVKNMADVLDTVTYTHHGPVVFDDDDNIKSNMALRWTMHDASNEAITFYKLNRAKNHADYLAALEHFTCPAQNFAFACINGDIAIKQQGRFPLKWQNQGRFVMDGSRVEHEWRGYIPYQHNPAQHNPERGFVSSANQHPTSSTYPYYYNGGFEYFRNRRLNQQLGDMSNISVEDMMRLQNDNYNPLAADILPFLLSNIQANQLKIKEKHFYNSLKEWDYHCNANALGASVFEAFWLSLHEMLWDELKDKKNIILPNDFLSQSYLKKNKNGEFIDIKATPKKESVGDLIQLSFSKACKKLQSSSSSPKGESLNENDENLLWGKFKNTQITHLARIPALGRSTKSGGHDNALNAQKSQHGPSWRMVVHLQNDGRHEAYGIYPGGQSGNPGSPFYDNGVDKWTKGEYFKLHFLLSETEAKGLAKETSH